MTLSSLPRLGVGIGLRRPHFDTILSTTRKLDWLEFIPENYMAYGGKPLRVLDAAAERWPLIAHGVALNLGGKADLDADYLSKLRAIIHRTGAAWFSDHLSWTALPHRSTHELLPLPYTREAVAHVVRRIDEVRRAVDRPFLIENISYYATLPGAEMSETDFLCEILERADCGLLLDVNNVYVNSRNHGFDALAWIESLPLDRVVQMHLAGHDDSRTIILDTHGAPIRLEVWDLYEKVLSRVPHASVLIERDTNIPLLENVLDEADRARAALDRYVNPPCPYGEEARATG